MTQDEIIRMAREAGFWTEKQPIWEKHEEWIGTSEELERFAALVAAHEREKQANLEKVVIAHIADLRACVPSLRQYQEMDATANEVEKAADELAAAIRARGE